MSERDETGANLLMSAVVMGAEGDVDAWRSDYGQFGVTVGGRTYSVKVEDVTDDDAE